METKVEVLEDKRVKLTVIIPAADVDARIKKQYKELANKYNFPGFRKGKAPRPVIDHALGAEFARVNVTDDLINETYPVAADDANLFIFSQPEFGEVELVENGKDYSYEVIVAVKPELELNSYDALDIEVPAAGATDAEVQEQMDILVSYYGTYEDAQANTKVKADSVVELKIAAADEKGADIDAISTDKRMYTMGGNVLPAAFDEAVLGMKKGESKEFAVEVAEDASGLVSSFKGQTINFTVDVIAVKKRVLPEVTDEWVLENYGYATVDMLKETIKQQIEAQKDEIIPQIKENSALLQLANRLEGDVPEGLVEDAEADLLQQFYTQLQRNGMTMDIYCKQQGISAEQLRDDIKSQAADMTKQNLALDAWARKFEISATEDQVLQEFVNAGAEDPKALMEEWHQAGRLHLIREGLVRTNALEDIIAKANVTEKVEEKKPAKKSSKKKAEETVAAE